MNSSFIDRGHYFHLVCTHQLFLNKNFSPKPFLYHSFSNWCLACWLSTCSIYFSVLGDYFLSYWNHLCCYSYNFTNKIAKLFHSAICILFICEWTDCFLFHLGSETNQILWVLIAQIFILCVSYFLKPHWFFVLIQMLATYGIAFIYILQLDHSLWSVHSTQTYFNLTLLNYLIFSLILLIGSKAVISYERSIFYVYLVSFCELIL